MSASAQTPRIFLAPAPRRVSEIFDRDDLVRLAALGELIIHEDGPVSDALFDEKAADAQIVIGQIDLPRNRLARAHNLRAVINVEGKRVSCICPHRSLYFSCRHRPPEDHVRSLFCDHHRRRVGVA